VLAKEAPLKLPQQCFTAGPLGHPPMKQPARCYASSAQSILCVCVWSSRCAGHVQAQMCLQCGPADKHCNDHMVVGNMHVARRRPTSLEPPCLKLRALVLTEAISLQCAGRVPSHFCD
jgi:hypothetical protein